MKKRILFYIGLLTAGGAERQLIYTALAAKKHGYDVRILVDNPINHYEEMLQNSGIEIIVVCPDSKKYRSLKRILVWSQLMKSYRPDIVHTFLHKSNFWGMFLASLHRVPMKIASIRNTDKNAFKFLKLYRLFADKIICNTQLAAEISCQEYGVKEHKLEVIYNAIDLNNFRGAKPLPDFRRNLGLAEETLLGVTVARITKKKNHIGLIKGLEILNNKDSLRNVHFLFVGFPEEKDLLEIIYKELEHTGLSSKVSILGLRDDIPNILKSCDFMVLPSFYEGFPNVILEAMATGLFVIATPTGGTTELVKNGINGLLSRSCSPEDLAHSIMEYLGMKETERQRIQAEASMHVEHYNQGSAFNSIFELYDGINLYKGSKKLE